MTSEGSRLVGGKCKAGLKTEVIVIQYFLNKKTEKIIINIIKPVIPSGIPCRQRCTLSYPQISLIIFSFSSNGYGTIAINRSYPDSVTANEKLMIKKNCISQKKGVNLH